MQKRTRVVVYNSSLNMTGIAANLKSDASLDVVCINPHSPTARQYVKELNPDVIAFDLNGPCLGLDTSLLRKRPGLLLVGVDPASGELLILSTQQTQVLSLEGLTDLIHQADADSGPDRAFPYETELWVFDKENVNRAG